MKRIAKCSAILILIVATVSWALADLVEAKGLNDYLSEGSQLYQNGKHKNALEAWKKGLDQATKQGHVQAQGVFLGRIGMLYYSIGQHKKALEFYEKSLSMGRRAKDKKGERSALRNIGVIYSNIGKYQEAISYYKESLAVTRGIGDIEGEIGILEAIGDSYTHLSQFQEAYRCFTNALAIASKNNELDESAILSRLGGLEYLQGREDKAFDYFRQALKIKRKRKDIRGQADLLEIMGDICGDMGKHDSALEYLAEALTIEIKLGNFQEQGDIAESIAKIYKGMGQHRKALKAFQKVLELRKKTKDRKGEATTLAYMGETYVLLEEYEKALDYHQESLDIDRMTGDSKKEIYNLTHIGVIYEKMADYDKALLFHNKSLAKADRIGEMKSQAQALANIGRIYNLKGQYESAIEYSNKSLFINDKIGNSKGRSINFEILGNVYRKMGQFEKAMEYLKKSLDINRKIGDMDGQAGSLANIGIVQLDLGQYGKAIESYEKALNIRFKTGGIIRGILGNIGNAFIAAGQYEKALIWCEQDLKLSRKANDTKSESVALGNMAIIFSGQGEYKKAVDFHKKALLLKRKIGDIRGEAKILYNLGKISRDLGDYDKATEYLEKALAISKRILAQKQQVFNLTGLGIVELSVGKSVRAEIRLEAAIEILEYMRENLGTDEERGGLLSRLPNCYGMLASARLAQGNQNGAFEAIERGRAKSFMDLLGTRGTGGQRGGVKTKKLTKMENQLSTLRKRQMNLAIAPAGTKTRTLQNSLKKGISELDKQRLDLIEQIKKLDPELGSLKTVDSPTIEEILSILPPGTALLEYFHVGKHTVSKKKKDQLWIFILNSQGLDFKAVDISYADLRRSLEKYADLVGNASSDFREIQAMSGKLYRCLIEPVGTVTQFKKADNLVIIPWGPMFKIPFAALAPHGGKPLGSKKSLVMAPSAGVYRYLLKKRGSGRGKVFAVGNPKTGMAPLQGAEREAKEIAGMFGKSIVRTRSTATESLIKSDYKALGGPDIVHLACHGIFNERIPQLSYLALTPDKKNDGKLEMHELFDLDWKGVSLVTLSACSSGKGRLGAGDDLVGLTRGFMFAGAPSILCSLWDVDDEATRALMLCFYKNYLDGMSKSEALRKAQLEMQKRKEWAHPYYWSAFVLFGDWE